MTYGYALGRHDAPGTIVPTDESRVTLPPSQEPRRVAAAVKGELTFADIRGTLSSGQLPANAAFLDRLQTWTSLQRFTGGLEVGLLGEFDPLSQASEAKTLVHRSGKWRAEKMLGAPVGDEVLIPKLADGTTVVATLVDPGPGPDSVPGPPQAPSAGAVYQSHLAATVTVIGYSPPADFRYFEFQYKVGTGAYQALATSSERSVVHSRLVQGESYAYRVRALDRAGNASGWFDVGSIVASPGPLQAGGVVLADLIADLAVTAPKIAIGAVQTAHLSPGAVIPTRLNLNTHLIY
jgi:hypothetical protein